MSGGWEQAPRRLVGRKIVSVHFHPHPDGRGGTYERPTITLDDGSVLTMSPQETEHALMGVKITRWVRR